MAKAVGVGGEMGECRAGGRADGRAVTTNGNGGPARPGNSNMYANY